MITINLIDQANVLSTADESRLKNFIIDKCHCSSEEIPWLKSVTVRDDGNAGYSGYWTASWTEAEADIKDLEAVIVLNSFYLKTVEQMEKTLAHEFGHHWTLGYYLVRQEARHFFRERAPWLYYRIRGIEPINDFSGDYSKGWDHCDKEIWAEDYKYHFSPYTAEHRMKGLVGNPTTEVKDYLKKLGRSYWE
jgi:hypothetical protein